MTVFRIKQNDLIYVIPPIPLQTYLSNQQWILIRSILSSNDGYCALCCGLNGCFCCVEPQSA
jgi:hypothetical protein